MYKCCTEHLVLGRPYPVGMIGLWIVDTDTCVDRPGKYPYN